MGSKQLPSGRLWQQSSNTPSGGLSHLIILDVRNLWNLDSIVDRIPTGKPTDPTLPPYFQQTGAQNGSGNCIGFSLLHLPPSEAPKNLGPSNMKRWVTWL